MFLKTLKYFIPLLIAILATFLYVYSHDVASRMKMIESEELFNINQLSDTIDNQLEYVAEDAIVLRDHLLSEMDERRTYNDFLEETRADLFVFVRAKKHYDQIRLLGLNGMELARANFNYGDPALVEEKDLQFKGDRYYFKETVRLDYDYIYLSPFDLNIEHGKVEEPLKPMIRFGTPTFDKEGNKTGVLIFNFLASTLFDAAKEIAAGSIGSFSLLNSSGYWLYDENPDNCWGFMYEDKKNLTFQSSFPDVWKKITSESSGQFMSKNGLLTFRNYSPKEGLQQHQIKHADEISRPDSQLLHYVSSDKWIILKAIPADVLSSETRYFEKALLLTFFLVTFLALSVSLLIAKSRVAEEETQEEKLEKEVLEQTYLLGERIKELDCLYSISKITERVDVSIEDIYLKIVDIIPPSWRYPEVACARIIIEGQAYATDNFQETAWRQTSNITVAGEQLGVLEVFYLEKMPEISGGPFLEEERKLLDEIAVRVGECVERKNAEEAIIKSEKKYKTLVEGTDIVAWEYDWKEQCFTYVSDIAVKKYGYPIKEWLEKGFWAEHIYREDREVAVNLCVCASEKGEDHDFEYRFIHADGHPVWVRDIVSVGMEGGKPSVLRGFLIDIDERKKAEEELLRAKEKAEEATKLKDKFVSFVSHDLQSPLAAMLGFLNLIRNNEAEVLNEGVKQILSGAINSGNKMSKLIEDLLSLSRLKTGALKAKPEFFDANLIGAKMVADFDYLAKEKGIELVNNIPRHTRIYADVTLTTQVIQNLVINSIKFCNKGNRITMYIPDGEKSAICVQDTGVGIKAKLLDKIFDYGVETSRKGTAGEIGTGLGLPFAKEIVEAHGGELTLETEEGQGCLFCIKLPYARPRILIVDDDPHFRLLQVQYLKKMDVDIVEVESGEEALNEVEKNLPHLIISDIDMPTMNGLEFVKRLKESEETKSIPIIIVSGKHGMEIRDEVFGLGAEDFVTKTSDLEELIPRVRRFIS